MSGRQSRHRILAAALAGSFAVLLVPAWALPLLGGAELLVVERDLLLWFHGWSGPGVDLALRELSQLSEGIVLFLVVVLTFLLVRRHHPGLGRLLVFVYPASLAAHWAGKLLVGRARPDFVEWSESLASGSSYPSGHALEAAAVYGVVAYVLARVEPGLGRVPIWTGTVLLVLSSGVTRLYLGVHWPSDILGGWASGLVLAGGCIWAHRASRPSDPDRVPVARSSDDGRTMVILTP